ncbi:MAG TPA: ROK family protein [Candidatus Cybelea sp.]|jgi:fructokinase
MRIGVDLGGTKIEIVALDEHGATLVRRRVATPAGDYEATLDAIAGLVRAVESEMGESATVGVGTPGAIDAATGRLKNSNSTVLNGKPLHRDLEARLGRELRLANDANCLALSEAIDGAAKDAGVVFVAILGTGVGGGIAVGRRVIAGRQNIAGEWGHNPLPWMTLDEHPGPRCYCGKRGCIETFLSGPALAAEFTALTGRMLRADEIAEAAEASDADATMAIQRYEERLARALAHVVNIVDPDVIVLGGGLSNMMRLYANVPPLMQPYVFSELVDLRIVPALHGDSSGVRGAALLW